MTSYADLAGTAPAKLSKSRSKAVVKPILKKLSQSEKNSLDLDRGWEGQVHYGSHAWAGGRAAWMEGPGREGAAVVYESGGAGRSARDVSFSISATDLNSGGGGGGAGRAKFSHTRSTSGTSHASVATTGSGHGAFRNGSFVHPFQQTPRTSTPPLSYANSLASFDQGNSRDYSPTITEDDDDLDPGYSTLRNNYQQHHSHSSSSNTNPYPSTTNIRRPSLASQRTSSLSDITAPPQLRINTSRSNSGPASRLAHVSSRSDLNLVCEDLDTPATITAATATATLPIISPSSSAAPMSPLRSSIENAGFRLRSRSELDSNYQQERIREERRKWQEKERLKEMKRDKEDVRKRDRADTKEAQRFEREQTVLWKESQTRLQKEPKKEVGKPSFSGTTSGRNSCSNDPRPSASRKRTPTDAEKIAFASRNYESTAKGQTPRADQVVFEAPRRNNTTKRKTQGAWTSFVLWFRTRVLRITKR